MTKPQAARRPSERDSAGDYAFGAGMSKTSVRIFASTLGSQPFWQVLRHAAGAGQPLDSRLQ